MANTKQDYFILLFYLVLFFLFLIVCFYFIFLLLLFQICILFSNAREQERLCGLWLWIGGWSWERGRGRNNQDYCMKKYIFSRQKRKGEKENGKITIKLLKKENLFSRLWEYKVLVTMESIWIVPKDLKTFIWLKSSCILLQWYIHIHVLLF